MASMVGQLEQDLQRVASCIAVLVISNQGVETTITALKSQTVHDAVSVLGLGDGICIRFAGEDVDPESTFEELGIEDGGRLTVVEAHVCAWVEPVKAHKDEGAPLVAFCYRDFETAAITEQDNRGNKHIQFWYRNNSGEGFAGPNNGQHYNIQFPDEHLLRDESGVWRTCGWTTGNPQFSQALFVDNELRFEWTEGEASAPVGPVPPEHDVAKFHGRSGKKLIQIGQEEEEEEV